MGVRKPNYVITFIFVIGFGICTTIGFQEKKLIDSKKYLRKLLFHRNFLIFILPLLIKIFRFFRYARRGKSGNSKSGIRRYALI